MEGMKFQGKVKYNQEGEYYLYDNAKGISKNLSKELKSHLTDFMSIKVKNLDTNKYILEDVGECLLHPVQYTKMSLQYVGNSNIDDFLWELVDSKVNLLIIINQINDIAA